MSPGKAFFTSEEVAERLGVSTKTVRRLIWRKKLYAVRIGRSIRIPVRDLEVYERSLRPVA